MTPLPQIRKILWHLQLLKCKLTLQFSLVLYLIIMITIPRPLRAAAQGQDTASRKYCSGLLHLQFKLKRQFLTS